MSPRLPLLILLAALMGAAPVHADTEDQADIEWSYYTVSGSSLAEVQDQMSEDGPKGFWAYTTWYVNWTGDCQTTVKASITLPELADDADLYDEEIAEFERMLAALRAHELQHVDFGIEFAQEVEESGCPLNSDAILQPYLAAERAFDAETEHGRLQGVYLDMN
jgi:predicted secreted Zn-dependent protease